LMMMEGSRGIDGSRTGYIDDIDTVLTTSLCTTVAVKQSGS